MRYSLGSHPPIPRPEEHLESAKEISHLLRGHVLNLLEKIVEMSAHSAANIQTVT